MSSPNNFTDGTLVGIVVGGDINDQAPDQSCNMKIFIPGLHGKDVKFEHLAFSTMQKSPSKSSQSTFEGTLDPGSCVFVRKDTGSNQCHIIGTGNEIYDPSARTPGNIDLLQIPAVQEALNRTIDVRIPPEIKESMVGGVKVRQKQEKGQLHKHSLLAGIPANGAIYSLSGAICPQVKGIATAAQAAANILSPTLASLIPGASVSLGNILGSLSTGNILGGLAGVAGSVISGAASAAVTGAIGGALSGGAAGAIAGALDSSVGGFVGDIVTGATQGVPQELLLDLQDQLFSKLSPQMKQSFTSMSLLSQSIETGTGGGFTSGSKVDPITLLTNAAELFSQCGNLSDMVQAMQQLQYDTSLQGADKLPKVSFMISSPFGIPMPMELDASGAITSLIPKPLQAAIDAFSKAMSSASAFPGINPGENLFGDSAQTMFDMFGRLSGPNQKYALDMAKKLNQSGIAQNFDKALKVSVKGGNPFEVLLK
jgi:hypothetical protein